MSRSGYNDDFDSCDNWGTIRWRGAVASAIRGQRGQAFLRELAAALDAMPEKELAAGLFQTADGEFCTLGVISAARGIDLSVVDPEDDFCREAIAKLLGIAPALAAEIMFENDDTVAEETWVDIEICGPVRPGRPYFERHRRSVRVPIENVGALRWAHVRKWIGEQLKQPHGGEE